MCGHLHYSPDLAGSEGKTETGTKSKAEKASGVRMRMTTRHCSELEYDTQKHNEAERWYWRRWQRRWRHALRLHVRACGEAGVSTAARRSKCGVGGEWA